MNKRFVDDEGRPDWKRIGHTARSAFAILLSMTVIFGGGYFAYSRIHDAYMNWRTAEDYLGEGKDKVEVVIPEGATVTDIGTILVDAKVVKSVKTFRSAANSASADKKFQSGKFALKTELPAKTAVDLLLDSKSRVVNRVTIIEGLRKERQWQSIAESKGISVEDLTAAASDTSGLALPEWAGGDPEGLFFPDTYEIPDRPTAKDILSKQTQRFNAVARDLGFEERAKELNLSPRELLTIASLVQAEVGKTEYMPQVAQVIYNRLAKKMPLDFDSTVHYAANKYDSIQITDEQRKIDSPYNTYLHKNAGKLPPGPIDSPGKAALEAATKPAGGNALFFVTVDLDSGETLFADTLSEHESNVAKFQAWCKSRAGRC